MSYPQSNVPAVQYQPQGQSLQQQDPNAHYQTPPSYVLVPIPQLDSSLQQQQPPAPSANVPTPQLPPRSLSPNPPGHHQQVLSQGPATTATSKKRTIRFPTPKPFAFNVYHVDGTKDLIPDCASQSDHIGYETTYRKMDYTDRTNQHTTVYDRSTNPPRLAGSCVYHHYWSNNLNMSFPFLKEPWEFSE